MTIIFRARIPNWVLAGATMLGIVVPTSAYAHDQIMVTARSYRIAGHTQSASKLVSFEDLNLGTSAHQQEFKRRVTITADYLCKSLGESEATPTGQSCRQVAEENAMLLIRPEFVPRRKSWVPGPAWQPPVAK